MIGSERRAAEGNETQNTQKRKMIKESKGYFYTLASFYSTIDVEIWALVVYVAIRSRLFQTLQTGRLEHWPKNETLGLMDSPLLPSFT